LAKVSTTNSSVTVIGKDAVTRSWWQRVFWDQFTLRKIIKASRVDLLISSSDFGMLYSPCPQLLLLRNSVFFSSIYRTSILPHHRWRGRLMFHIKRLLIAASVRQASQTVVASHAMGDETAHALGLRPERFAVNPFGVPLDRFQTATCHLSEKNSSVFRLLYVAEYCDYKNLAVLLRALQALNARGEAGILLVTTADPWQNPDDPNVAERIRIQDQLLASDPSVSSSVKFCGAVPYQDMPRLYQDSDLFVFPSLVESFGHPLVEAMASGVPVLAADLPVCKEVCGEAACYFDPLDPLALAADILTLKGDTRKRLAMSERGRERVRRLFDWNHYVVRLVQTIEKVAENA
jgi:glycosyltransferase involved in cell wall biosynthesis